MKCFFNPAESRWLSHASSCDRFEPADFQKPLIVEIDALFKVHYLSIEDRHETDLRE